MTISRSVTNLAIKK